MAPVGGDGVSVHVSAGEKEASASLASIMAAHDKRPLFLVASGKTPRVEQSQLGAPDDCILARSDSGWTTVSKFYKYLAWLRDSHSDQELIHLVLNCCSAETRTFAASLGITLHFIPPG
jgi:hypothetical protein